MKGRFAYLRFHEKRHTEVNGIPSHDIVLIKHSLAPGLGKVEGTTDVVLLEHIPEGPLVILGEFNHLHRDITLGGGLDVRLNLGASSKELVAERAEVVDNLGQDRAAEVSTEQQSLTRLRHTEVHHGLHGRPVGVNQVVSEASHLTGTGHLNTEEGVSTSQTGPTELGNLGSKVVTLGAHEVDGLRDIAANEGLGSHIDEVGAQNLANEGEGTRSTEVALNDLQERLSAFLVSLDDLHVERTSDVPGLGDLLSNVLDTFHNRVFKGSRGEDKSCITRVDTSRLNMLTDSVHDKLAVGGNRVNINLLGAFNELGDNHRVVGGDGTGVEQLLLELIMAVDDVHGSTGQDVTGADQNGVSHRLGKFLSLRDGGKFLPGRLVNTDAVKDLRELVSVLGLVNVLGISTENVSATSLLQTQGNVLRQLTTDRDNDTASVFKLVDIHNTLIAQFFEVESVSSVEVGGVSFGVVVNHDSLLAQVPQGQSSVDCTPVELNRASNTVNTATQDERAVVIKGDIVRSGVVGGVEVVGVGRELSSQGVNPLHPGSDTESSPASADIVLSRSDQKSDLLVGESKLLGPEHHFLLDTEEATNLLQFVVAIDNVLELVQEPLVNLGQLMDLFHGVVLVEHSLTNGQPTSVSRVLQNVIQVLEGVTLEAEEPGVNLADGLLERLLEGTTNGHDFTDGLHGASNVPVDMLEFAQIPSGDLGDDVVQAGLEVGGGGLGDCVGEFREGVAQPDLGSSVGQRVTGSLGGQSGRTRKTSIDLNDTVVETVGLQSVLDVAFTNNTQMTNDLDGGSTEHVVLLVRQGLTGGNDDTVTSVDTQGVKVLHVADCDTVVGGIPDDFILDLLPALERLLNQNLRGKSQGARRQVLQLLGVVGESGTQTTKGIGRTDDDRVANSLCGLQCLIDGTNSDGFGDGDVDLLQCLGEKITVLTGLKGLNAGSQNLDAIAVKDTHAVHLHTQVQSSLTTEGEHDTVWAFPLNDVGDIFRGDGEVVHFVCKLVVCLDSRDVGVDQDGMDAGFLESLESLGAYIF